MSTQIHFIRHGETEAVRERRFVGSLNVPLNDTGIQQAANLKKFVSETKPDLFLSSPMLRVIQTTEAAEIPAHSLQILADLREIDFGDWEGLSFADIKKVNPEKISEWSSLDDTFAFPGGESIQAFNRRIEQVADMLRNYEARNIVVFSHGGVIRSLICKLLGLPLHHQLAFKVAPASISTVHLNGKLGVLTTINHQPNPAN